MFVAAVFCVTAADERLNLIKRTHFDNLPALHCMQSARGVNHREESRARADVLRAANARAPRDKTEDGPGKTNYRLPISLFQPLFPIVL